MTTFPTPEQMQRIADLLVPRLPAGWGEVRLAVEAVEGDDEDDGSGAVVVRVRDVSVRLGPASGADGKEVHAAALEDLLDAGFLDAVGRLFADLRRAMAEAGQGAFLVARLRLSHAGEFTLDFQHDAAAPAASEKPTPTAPETPPAPPSAPSGPRVWDKAKYHADGTWPADLDPEVQAYVHTGLFLGWLIERGLVSDFFREEAGDAIDAFRRRERTGPQIYGDWDGALTDDMLSPEGNAFAADYFDLSRGRYLDDYAETLAEELPTPYHVLDTWGNYDRLRVVLDRRHAEWRAAREPVARAAIVDSVALRMRDPAWPQGLDETFAAVPMGLYLAWCAERGLLSVEFRGEHAAELAELRLRRTTGPRLALRLGGVFREAWLCAGAAAFTRRYYAPRFLKDLLASTPGLTSPFVLPDTWGTYATVEPVLDRRFAQWSARHGGATAPEAAPAPPSPEAPPPAAPPAAAPPPPRLAAPVRRTAAVRIERASGTGWAQIIAMAVAAALAAWIWLWVAALFPA